MTDRPADRGGEGAGAAQEREVPFRGGGFRTRSLAAVGPLFFLVLVLAWEAGSRLGWIGPLVLPAPSEALAALVELAQSGNLLTHLAASLQRLVLGWTLGTILGLAVGLSAGLFSLARAAVVPFTAAIFPIPKIALLPLFVIWFGIGEESKTATILFGVFFPTVISVYGGVDNVDRNLVRMSQSFGLSWFSIVRKVVIPGAMPAILSGFRISASIGIILLVAAEMIGAEYGIGAYVLLAGNLMATDQLIAGVAMLSVLGLAVSWGLTRLEKAVLKWR